MLNRLATRGKNLTNVRRNYPSSSNQPEAQDQEAQDQERIGKCTGIRSGWSCKG